MKGFFVEIERAEKKITLYPLSYDEDPETKDYSLSGTWKPTVMEVNDDRIIIKPSQGPAIRIIPLDIDSFKTFCKTQTVLCDGWSANGYDNEYPYKVTLESENDHFLLMAENMNEKPIDFRLSYLRGVFDRQCLGFTIIHGQQRMTLT